MPSKKPQTPKRPADMTTDEAIAHLFHPKVVEHAKRHARAAEKPATKADPKSMDGS
ncbi:MAG TPA: hypothetical protein VFI12_05045 [Thermomicrobiales bacterium]|nr:hypothetical protein [Thermomicrobiales bacterium]